MPSRRRLLASSLALPAALVAWPGAAGANWPVPVLGDPAAPVELREFASLTCPACAQLHAEGLKHVRDTYIATGQAKLVFRDFPLDLRAWLASAVAHCAGPERFFAYLDVLYAEQRRWVSAPSNAAARRRLDASGLPDAWRAAGRTREDVEALRSVAGTVNALVDLAQLGGLPPERTLACLGNFDLLDWILEGYQEGRNVYKVEGTPTLFVDGERFVGVVSHEAIGRVIDAALARR